MSEPIPQRPSRPAFWSGEGIGARSARFTIVLMAPIAIAGLFGAGTWIAYAVLASVLGFIVDTGGPAWDRLLRAAIAAAVIMLGGWLGTEVAGHTGQVALMLAGTALVYGLFENAEPSMAFAARFLCLCASMGALFSPIMPIDVAVVLLLGGFVVLVSVGWDVATGEWRPSTEPPLSVVIARLEAHRIQRWAFAIIVALTVAAAFLASLAFGVTRPNWAIFAVVVTMRMDATVSRQTVVNLLLGTVVGALAAAGYGTLFPSPAGLVTGMTLAALLRWPAQQLHTALGLGAMAAFVVLLIELASNMAGIPSHAPVDRLIDITLGCAFAIAGLVVNAAVQALLRRTLRPSR